MSRSKSASRRALHRDIDVYAGLEALGLPDGDITRATGEKQQAASPAAAASATRPRHIP